jgi:hypothetical protein
MEEYHQQKLEYHYPNEYTHPLLFLHTHGKVELKDKRIADQSK